MQGLNRAVIASFPAVNILPVGFVLVAKNITQKRYFRLFNYSVVTHVL